MMDDMRMDGILPSDGDTAFFQLFVAGYNQRRFFAYVDNLFLYQERNESKKSAVYIDKFCIIVYNYTKLKLVGVSGQPEKWR